MGRHDWYRNTSWDDEIREAFLARLKRTRGTSHRAQYLRIQASYLADAGELAPAMLLLDMVCRDCPDPSEMALVHEQRARIFAMRGDQANVVESFRSALSAERARPNRRTTAWLEFACYVVRHDIKSLYDEVDGVLSEFHDDSSLVFPAHEYMYCSARAMLAQARNDLDGARHFATLALASAERTHSGFARHPKIGLVSEADPLIHPRLLTIVSISR